MSLQDRFRTLRKRVGLTQAEFAESLGLSLTAYKNYEKGTRDPPGSVLVLMCIVHDAVPAWLLKGDSVEKVTQTLDVTKTEAVFRYIDVFRREQNLTLNRRQQATLFNIVFKHIDDEGFDDEKLDAMLLVSLGLDSDTDV